MIESGADIGRRFFASQDERRGGPAPELCAPGYIAELGGNPGVPWEGHDGFARGFYAAFPDMRHEIVETFGDASKVTVRFVITGTHREPFFGIPATQRAVRVVANVLLHLENGRVQHLQGVFDESGLLRQLGVLQG
jgi:hypothetical protein